MDYALMRKAAKRADVGMPVDADSVRRPEERSSAAVGINVRNNLSAHKVDGTERLLTYVINGDTIYKEQSRIQGGSFHENSSYI